MKRSFQHRVVLHFDVDAFYVACERELRPELRNKPLGVSQYNPYGDLRDMSIDDPSRLVIQPSPQQETPSDNFNEGPINNGSMESKDKDVLKVDVSKDGGAQNLSPRKRPHYDQVSGGTGNNKAVAVTPVTSTANNNGSLIAVSYEARAHNVKRNDRGRDAVKKCPSLYVIQVPVKHGKADLTIYRKASQRVMKQMINGMIQASYELYDIITRQRMEDSSSSNFKSSDDNKSKEEILKKNGPKELSQIKVEKASVDEVYIEVSSSVNALLQALDEMNDSFITNDHSNCSTVPEGQKSCNKRRKEKIFQQIIERCCTQTTVGGLETNEAGLANNALSKDELRRGSSLQVLDQQSMDTGSLSWWNRPSEEWWIDDEERALAIGAALCAKTRLLMSQSFDGVYTLSGGISNNKVMAKLASGLKKPNRQTLINPKDEQTIQKLFYPLPVGRLRGLGGKFGDHVEQTLQISTVGELARIPKSTLLQYFSQEQTEMLHRMAQGICDEPVEERTKSKSIAAGKTFRNHLSVNVDDYINLRKWLVELASEVDERLEMDFEDNSRHASLLTVNLLLNTNHGVTMKGSSSMSKSTPLSYGSGVKEDHGEIAFKLAKELLSSVSKTTSDGKKRTVNGMSVSASNFVPLAKGRQSIMESFQKASFTTVDVMKNNEAKVSEHATSRHDGAVAGITAGNKKQRVIGPSSSAKVDAFLVPSSQLKASTVPLSTTKPHEDQDSTVAEKELVIVDDDDDVDPPTTFSTTATTKTPAASKKAISAPVTVEDKDLEYARRLQESYDKENELWSRLEQRRGVANDATNRHTNSSSKRKGSTGNQTSTVTNSKISSFFRPKSS